MRPGPPYRAGEGGLEGVGSCTSESVTVLVNDYDRGIEFFVHPLGFELLSDSPAQTECGRRRRFVVVGPPGASTGIVLARPDGAEERRRVGTQVG